MEDEELSYADLRVRIHLGPAAVQQLHAELYKLRGELPNADWDETHVACDCAQCPGDHKSIIMRDLYQNRAAFYFLDESDQQWFLWNLIETVRRPSGTPSSTYWIRGAFGQKVQVRFSQTFHFSRDYHCCATVVRLRSLHEA